MNDKKYLVRWELKQLLKKRGLTYQQFGELFEPTLDTAHVTRLMRRNSITFDMLERIVEALELEPEELTDLLRFYKA